MEKREIKFRVWDIGSQKMRLVKEISFRLDYVEDIDGAVSGITVQTDDGDEACLNFILMQYTGLKDKNGKEIYEGDVLQSDVQGYEGDYSNGIIVISNIISTGNISYKIEIQEYGMRVVGNIYENPELIKD